MSRKLPESFIRDNTSGLSAYSPGWERAFNLFAEIAELDGLRVAEHVFTEVLKCAQQTAVETQRPPQTRHTGSRNPDQDIEWLDLYFTAIRRGLTKTAAVDYAYRTAKHRPHSRLALEQQIRRLQRTDK